MNLSSPKVSFVLIVVTVLTASQSSLFAQDSPTVSVATLQVSDKAWSHFNRAKTAAQHNRVADSERESLKAIEMAPGFAEAYLLLAATQMREHNYGGALANIQAARAVDPGTRWSGILMAGAYNGLGRFSEARALLFTMQGNDANSWQAAYECARAETGLANAQGALFWSETALNAAPRHIVDAHLVRANALLLTRRWSDAAAQMDEYLKSPGPQSHRQEVLGALAMARQHAEDVQIPIPAPQ